MGQKAKLIHQYFSLKHMFDILEKSERPCKAVPSGEDIVFMSREFSVMDLKEKIEAVESALDAANKRVLAEKYWEKHPNKKESLENKLQNLHNSIKNRNIETREAIKEKIKSVLGDRWTCTLNFNYDGATMEIGIENNDPKNPGYTFKFGHDFDLYFDKEYNLKKGEYEKEYELRMNYGSLGTFNLTGNESNKDRIAFIVGMSDFMTNTNLINFIKKQLTCGCKENMKNREEIKQVENTLKNPTKQ
jgi:hypothetical protein